MHLPVSIYTIAGHDDALFLKNAYKIVKGSWLGSYNQMTLAKGPGFSLFLAANAILGTPVTLLTALLYLFACGLIANTLRYMGLNKYFVLIIFITILFHPALFPTRIIRDNIYPALSLIVIAGVIKLMFVPVPKDNHIVNIIPYGFVFGLFWITREEGIWIVPGILLLLFIKTVQLKQQNLPAKNLFYRFIYFLSIAVIFICLIASINYHRYGMFEVVDFKGKAFSSALKSLNKIDMGVDLPHLPVSAEKRKEIYKISPTFMKLKDYFDNKGKKWTINGDYPGCWFMWALRDAVADVGYYKSPITAASFYNDITNEIEKACDLGKIRCKTNPVPFMPNISITQMKELPQKILHALKLATVQFPISLTSGYSLEPLDQLQKARNFLGRPLTTLSMSEYKTELRGWYYSIKNDWIALSCLVNGTINKKGVDRLISSDLAEYFKDPNANFQRFSIIVPTNEDCYISLDSLSSNSYKISTLFDKQKSRLGLGDNGTLYIDNVFQTEENYDVKYLNIKESLSNLYKLILPVISVLGIFAYLICFILICLRKKTITNIFLASTLMWFLFFSRIILLVLVDISSFPAINELYMSAAFPILCLSAFLSIQLIDINYFKMRSDSRNKNSS
jgi:hypothetical protein